MATPHVIAPKHVYTRVDITRVCVYFVDLIFVNMHLFHGFNFRESPVNRKNRENWLPKKKTGHTVVCTLPVWLPLFVVGVSYCILSI